jgi:hypothetical protein
VKVVRDGAAWYSWRILARVAVVCLGLLARHAWRNRYTAEMGGERKKRAGRAVDIGGGAVVEKRLRFRLDIKPLSVYVYS